jgi:DNA-binding response OmpR family regulator
MPVAKAAPIRIEIEPEDLVRVLYVEHDHDYRNTMADSLKQWGCRVDAVARPIEAARLLEPDKYQMIIVDIGFNAPDISGDQFLVQNRDLLGGTTKVALTGQSYRIGHWEEFNSMGVQVVIKGDELPQLQEMTQTVFDQRRKRVLKSLTAAKDKVLSGHAASSEEYPLATVALAELQNELLNELQAMGEKDSQVVLYKGKKYSVNDLIHEVEQGTEVGRAHVRMMLNLRGKDISHEA